jgi:hypothetical protein
MTLTRRAAERLAAHASRALPRDKADWARAMTHELAYVCDDVEALKWALGCVAASYSERIKAMQTGTLNGMSRWVLALEMLACFVPLSALFAAVVDVMAAGIMPAPDALLYLSAAASGPIGLAVALNVIARNRAVPKMLLAAMLVAAAWTLAAFVMQGRPGMDSPMTSQWREFVLIALLPAVGAAHLAFVAKRAPRARAMS